MPGVYYYECTPHKTMGMIALVVVGEDTSNLDTIADIKIGGKSKKKLAKLVEELQNRNYSVFNGHEHSFSIQDINNQTYTVLSTTGGSHNSSDDSVFDQITWVSMREKPFVTHIRLDGIVKGLKSNN